MKSGKGLMWLFVIIIIAVVGVTFMVINKGGFKSADVKYYSASSTATDFAGLMMKNADAYISSNVNIDKVKSKLEVNASKILNLNGIDSKYSNCSGKLSLTKVSGAYSYAIDSNCVKESDTYNVDYVKNKLDYRLNFSNIEPVSDGYIGYSNVEGYSLPLDAPVWAQYNNALLIKFDEQGNVSWMTKYGDTLKDGLNRTSRIIYTNIFEETDGYVVFGRLEIENGSRFVDKYGIGTVPIMQKYSKSGKLVTEQIYPYKEIGKDKYLGVIKGENGNYYVSKSDTIVELNTVGKVLNTLKFSFANNSTLTLGAVLDNNYYFYSIFNPNIYKYDSTGKKIWETNIQNDSKTALLAARSLTIYNNKIVINMAGSAADDGIYVYNLDGKLFKKLDYNSVSANGKDTSFTLTKIYVENNMLGIISNSINYVLVDTINKSLNYTSRSLFDNINYAQKLNVLTNPVEISIMGDNRLIKCYYTSDGNILFGKVSVN